MSGGADGYSSCLRAFHVSFSSWLQYTSPKQKTWKSTKYGDHEKTKPPAHGDWYKKAKDTQTKGVGVS